jgi:hypothetical protein
MANDIPDSKILEIEYFMDSKKKEIVDFIERKTSELDKEKPIPKHEIFDEVVNVLCNDMPSGPIYYMTHILLTNALMFSLGCGWLSQSMVNEKDPRVKEEYLQRFGRAIEKAYDIGRKYASQPS